MAWTGKRGSGMRFQLAPPSSLRRAAGQHQLRIGVVLQEESDLHAAVGKVGTAEILTAIGTSIDAIGGAGKDEIGIVRMHKDGKCFDLRSAHVSSHKATSGASKHRRRRRPCLCSRNKAANTGKHIRWGHNAIPSR